MATHPRNGKLLYHITPIENLKSILTHGLHPRKNVPNFTDVADVEILKDRTKFKLQEFTPFHFIPKSPFAGKVQLTFPEKEFVYLTVTRKLAIHNNFKIVPSHPLHYNEEPLTWDIGMNTIDWELMAKRDYKDHECKEVCMAECIFEGYILPEHIYCIFVKTEQAKKEVDEMLVGKLSQVFVNVNKSMFLDHD